MNDNIMDMILLNYDFYAQDFGGMFSEFSSEKLE